MTQLVELSNEKHGDLKVADSSVIAFAQKQHAININVAEVCNASSDFPLFFSRNGQSGRWMILTITSFEQERNLFIEDGQWTALHQPIVTQTYPFYLMQAPNDQQGYTVGFEQSNEAFSTQTGQALFVNKKQASPYLNQVTQLLEASINQDIQTYQFSQALEELGLLKAIDILVEYHQEGTQTLRGLHTIDEDKLQSLTGEQLAALNSKGYLAPIYAILMSIQQLNAVISKHNKSDSDLKIKQLKLEVSRNETAQ